MNIQGFEQDFQAACLKHGIKAAFVLVKSNDEKGSLLMVGGDSQLSDFVESSLLPNTVEFGQAKH